VQNVLSKEGILKLIDGQLLWPLWQQWEEGNGKGGRRKQKICTGHSGGNGHFINMGCFVVKKKSGRANARSDALFFNQ
jgi:hypothetical protein